MIHTGIPEDVIKRAADVLDAVQNNRRIERLSLNVSDRDKRAKVLFLELNLMKTDATPRFNLPSRNSYSFDWLQDAVDKLLAFDVDKGDVKKFLQDLYSSN